MKKDINMKRLTAWLMALLLIVCAAALAGCGAKTEDPGSPPEEIINPSDGAAGENNGTAYEGDILENAVTVQIGRNGQKDWSINMYNNDAAATMLGYLSSSGLLFPTYTYEEEQGFVAQNVRGSYTKDDETTITDVKAGELYLFSGGQLRFCFMDMEGANITATPVGYYTGTEGLMKAVEEAYQSNIGGTWDVDVYFWITKTIYKSIMEEQ